MCTVQTVHSLYTITFCAGSGQAGLTIDLFNVHMFVHNCTYVLCWGNLINFHKGGSSGYVRILFLNVKVDDIYRAIDQSLSTSYVSDMNIKEKLPEMNDSTLDKEISP